MTYTLDLSAIKECLQKFDDVRQIAFGVFLLERALPGYFQFQLDAGSFGGAALRAASVQCWAALECGERQGAKFISVDECERSMPDSEDHTSPYMPPRSSPGRRQMPACVSAVRRVSADSTVVNRMFNN